MESDNGNVSLQDDSPIDHGQMDTRCLREDQTSVPVQAMASGSSNHTVLSGNPVTPISNNDNENDFEVDRSSQPEFPSVIEAFDDFRPRPVRIRLVWHPGR